jgi:F420-dependent methylenetetrahydromethanopterin dehydrogenase
MSSIKTFMIEFISVPSTLICRKAGNNIASSIMPVLINESADKANMTKCFLSQSAIVTLNKVNRYMNSNMHETSIANIIFIPESFPDGAD